MGRIKSKMVKKAAKQLLSRDASLSEDFTNNKKVLGNTMLPSKSTRNKIAGYIARLVKMQKAGPKVKKVEPIASDYQ